MSIPRALIFYPLLGFVVVSWYALMGTAYVICYPFSLMFRIRHPQLNMR